MSIFHDIAIVLAAAVAVGLLFWRIRQPLILGYVLAGLILSPLTPGPRIHNVHTFQVMAEVGVILLMFSVGTEFSVPELLRVKWVALVGGPIGVLLSIGLGAGSGLLVGWPLNQGIAVGCIVAVASTMVLARLLVDRGEPTSGAGRIAVSISLVDDLAVVIDTEAECDCIAVERNEFLDLAVCLPFHGFELELLKRSRRGAGGIGSAILRDAGGLASVVEPIDLRIVAARQGRQRLQPPTLPNGCEALSVSAHAAKVFAIGIGVIGSLGDDRYLTKDVRCGPVAVAVRTGFSAERAEVDEAPEARRKECGLGHTVGLGRGRSPTSHPAKNIVNAIRIAITSAECAEVSDGIAWLCSCSDGEQGRRRNQSRDGLHLVYLQSE